MGLLTTEFGMRVYHNGLDENSSQVSPFEQPDRVRDSMKTLVLNPRGAAIVIRGWVSRTEGRLKWHAGHGNKQCPIPGTKPGQYQSNVDGIRAECRQKSGDGKGKLPAGL